MIAQGVLFFSSLSRMRHTGHERETREWLCGVLALFVGLPLVLFVVHLLFYASVAPEPPPVAEAEALCRHASLANVTVRHVVPLSLIDDKLPGPPTPDVEVDVTYLRYRVLCVLQHNTTLTVSKTYVLAAVGADTELSRQRLANASAVAAALYPLDAPPFQRWYYRVSPSAGHHDDTTSTYIEEQPRTLGVLVRLLRWAYYLALLSGVGPLCYLAIYALTMHWRALPLLALASKLRQQLTNRQAASPV
jgi:hypothetical protein